MCPRTLLLVPGSRDSIEYVQSSPSFSCSPGPLLSIGLAHTQASAPPVQTCAWTAPVLLSRLDV